MIMYSIRARVARIGPDAPIWAHQIAELVSRKTGVATEVVGRIGGFQDFVWLTRYEDFAAFDKAQAMLLADADYNAMLNTAREQGLFDTVNVEAALWRQI